MEREFVAGDYAVIVSEAHSDNIGRMVRILKPFYHERGKPYDILVEACDKMSGLMYLVRYEGDSGEPEEYEGACIELPMFTGNLGLIFSSAKAERCDG